MISSDKSDGKGSSLLPISIILNIALGIGLFNTSMEFSELRGELQASERERDRLESVIQGVMLGGN